MKFKNCIPVSLVSGLVTCFLLISCDQSGETTTTTPDTEVVNAKTASPEAASLETAVPDQDSVSAEQNIHTQTQFNIGNKSYLFDVSDHSIEELESLLIRAEEISSMNMDEYPDLDIVMIIHGPDIDWFTQKNYEENRQLVDLAAKLDAFDIIDMKVCESTMNNRGVKREDIPAFIESVPFAPDEIQRLLEENFINL